MNQSELKAFLDEKTDQYNRSVFIQSDPIQIPHKLTKKEDIEIIGFIVATISWGQRVTIIRNANYLLEQMSYSPFEFIINAGPKELMLFDTFKHRTFNGIDLKHFINALKHIYVNHSGLECILSRFPTAYDNINYLKQVFFEIEHDKRTLKHVSDPHKGSASKRINMFLRWMVRSDKRGVDFGLWKQLSPSQLMLPLDIHTQSVSRKLNLLKRRQNDWKAVEELTHNLRKLDQKDPVKYDFALFGLGVFEGFAKT